MTLTSSFEMQLTDKILQHVEAMTNLDGRRSIPAWRDVDIEELQAYVGLLTLADIYRSKDESTLSLWREKSGALSGLRCLTRGFTTSAEHCGSTSSYPDPDVMLTSWVPSTKFGICGHTVWPMQALCKDDLEWDFFSSKTDTALSSRSNFEKVSRNVFNLCFSFSLQICLPIEPQTINVPLCQRQWKRSDETIRQRMQTSFRRPSLCRISNEEHGRRVI